MSSFVFKVAHLDCKAELAMLMTQQTRVSDSSSVHALPWRLIYGALWQMIAVYDHGFLHMIFSLCHDFSEDVGRYDVICQSC